MFIDCLCDRKFERLVKHGKARKEDISRAWEYIYSEYSDASGNSTSKHLISLSKDISFHDAKLRAVGLCLKVLQHSPDARCIHILKSYGYNYPFDITRPEEYARSLEAIAERTGAIVFTLQLKRAEYDREAIKVENKPMTREAFYDMLAVLFEHFHSRIDPNLVTVSEFISYRKRYELEMLALKKQSERSIISSKYSNLKNG